MALHRIFSTQEDSSQNFQHSGGLFTEFSALKMTLHRIFSTQDDSSQNFQHSRGLFTEFSAFRRTLHRIFSTQEDSSQNFQHSRGLFTEFSALRRILHRIFSTQEDSSQNFQRSRGLFTEYTALKRTLHRIFSTQEDSSQNFQHSGGLFTEFSISRTIRFFLDLGFLYLLTYLVYSDIWRENVLSPSSVILKIEAVSPFETPKQTKHTATSRNSKFCPPLKATSVSMQLFFTVKRKVQKWLATSTPDAANIQDSTELYKASCICV